MACEDSFSDCIADPLSAVGTAADTARNTFSTLTGTLNFSVNLVLYVLYAALIVFVGYNLFQTIYKLFAADNEQVAERFWQGWWNAVLAALGIVLIFGARFFLVTVLRLLGFPDAENIFRKDNPLSFP